MSLLVTLLKHVGGNSHAIIAYFDPQVMRAEANGEVDRAGIRMTRSIEERLLDYSDQLVGYDGAQAAYAALDDDPDGDAGLELDVGGALSQQLGKIAASLDRSQFLDSIAPLRNDFIRALECRLKLQPGALAWGHLVRH